MTKDLTLSIRRDKSRWSGVKVVGMTGEERGDIFLPISGGLCIYKWKQIIESEIVDKFFLFVGTKVGIRVT